MHVSEVMSHELAVVEAGATVSAAAEIMEKQKVGSLPVIDHDARVVGIVTDRDIAVRSDAYGKDPLVAHVRDVMSSPAVTAFADDEIEAAAQLMSERRIRRLPVIDRSSHQIEGMLSVDDLVGCDGDLSRYVQRILVP